MPQAKAREMQGATPSDVPTHARESAMLVKIRRLSPDQLAQLDVIIDDMVVARRKKQHNEAFVNALTQLSDESFRRIWDNPKDAEYDNL